MSGVDRFDVAAAAAAINRENRREALASAERKNRARAEGARLAKLLKERDPRLVRVWGFGSAFEEGRPFHASSDIDLAIEGGDLLLALSMVGTSEFRVDVVDLTRQEDQFAKTVREKGTLL